MSDEGCVVLGEHGSSRFSFLIIWALRKRKDRPSLVEDGWSNPFAAAAF